MDLKTKWHKMLRMAVKVVLCIVALLVAYVFIGAILSLITVNGNATSGEDVVVYFDNNGVHTDIVVPTRTEWFDWSTIVPADDTSAKKVGRRCNSRSSGSIHRKPRRPHDLNDHGEC